MSDPTSDNSIEVAAKRLKIIWAGIALTQIVFCGIVYNGVRTGSFRVNPSSVDTFMIVATAFALSGVFAGGFVSRRMIARAAASQGTEDKLRAYKSACIIRWATLEGPNLFVIVSYMITGNMPFLIIFVALLLLLVIDRPSESRMRRDLLLPQI